MATLMTGVRNVDSAFRPGNPGVKKVKLPVAEKARLLAVFSQIGQHVLASLDLEAVLDALVEPVVLAGGLRSLSVALVDEEKQEVRVARSVFIDSSGAIMHGPHDGPCLRYDREEPDGIAEVARTGKREVVVGWDERLNPGGGPPGDCEDDEDRVFCFLPVKRDERVLAVLAMESKLSEQDRMLAQIEAMCPFLNQVAIALDHARLYREAQERRRVVLEMNAQLKAEIVEYRQGERERIRRERLEALKEISRGINHNLNNILSGILFPAQVLQRQVQDKKILEDLKFIEASANRASNLLHRFNQTMHGEMGKKYPVPVREALLEAVQGMTTQWKQDGDTRKVEVDVDVADVPPVGGEWVELHDLFVNLLTNAFDAMPDGGTVVVDARSEANGVRMRVRDTGVGMDEDVRRRVFEPFFTTKATVGAGLGLSSVYGTVSRWGGRIDVESAPGQGTVFTIWLPAWVQDAGAGDAGALG